MWPSEKTNNWQNDLGFGISNNKQWSAVFSLSFSEIIVGHPWEDTINTLTMENQDRGGWWLWFPDRVGGGLHIMEAAVPVTLLPSSNLQMTGPLPVQNLLSSAQSASNSLLWSILRRSIFSSSITKPFIQFVITSWLVHQPSPLCWVKPQPFIVSNSQIWSIPPV